MAIYEIAGHEKALKDLKWHKVKEEEMLMIQKKNVWEFVDRLEDRKVIKVK